LKSAKTHGKTVKAIVVTGSCNAMTTGQDIDSRTFTSTSWLPLSIDDAITAQHPYISYCVAKAESEKAIWKFVEEEKPNFSVTNLLPCLIFGPPLQPVQSVRKINYSNDVFYSLFNGVNEVVPATSFPSYVRSLENTLLMLHLLICQ
jgi:nucleoside-diphosphate-sugar epimerase